MTGSDQKGYHAPADEACAAHYHDGHAFPPRCRAPLGLNEGATLPVDGGARKWSEMVARCVAAPRADIFLERYNDDPSPFRCSWEAGIVGENVVTQYKMGSTLSANFEGGTVKRSRCIH
jgi:hypothetical protein